jgi:hypothetical protein
MALPERAGASVEVFVKRAKPRRTLFIFAESSAGCPTSGLRGISHDLPMGAVAGIKIPQLSESLRDI